MRSRQCRWCKLEVPGHDHDAEKDRTGPPTTIPLYQKKEKRLHILVFHVLLHFIVFACFASAAYAALHPGRSMQGNTGRQRYTIQHPSQRRHHRHWRKGIGGKCIGIDLPASATQKSTGSLFLG